MRPCSRCGRDLLLQWNGPWATGVWMELCPACDAERLAASALIDWHRDLDRELKALPTRFEDWETETMHATAGPAPNTLGCTRPPAGV
ncbi:DUF6300 family protein [Streptomyces sp. NPDC002779]|uniref:DUF6300 family protein n=1 Tax=Streptomyces sp. NPDC002779 TaxID=3364664 RepID=UPI0036A8C606